MFIRIAHTFIRMFCYLTRIAENRCDNSASSVLMHCLYMFVRVMFAIPTDLVWQFFVALYVHDVSLFNLGVPKREQFT